ncbi:MAG: hypothetical protein R3215_03260 [Halomonas sp.]|nr:hypothetical protein [Halomonas sp.]
MKGVLLTIEGSFGFGQEWQNLQQQTTACAIDQGEDDENDNETLRNIADGRDDRPFDHRHRPGVGPYA